MDIDWGRIARPQPDGYDASALREMAWERWPKRPLIGPRFLGLCLIHDDHPRDDGLAGADLDHPNLDLVAAAVRRWTLGEQCLSVADSFTPLVLVNPQDPAGRGCSSGHVTPSDQDGNVHVFVTVDDPVGCAEGLTHEVAHQRLHVLGIDLDHHDGRLLANDGEWRFFSPIRRDAPRPMSALIHGVYAWTFMLEIDLANVGEWRGEEYLAINVPKVRRGLQEIEQNVKATSSGNAFVQSLLNWGQDTVLRGEAALSSAGVAEVPVPPKEW